MGLIGVNCFLMMNCFCGMVDRRKAFSLIFSRDHCQRSPPSRISDTPRAGLFKKWDDLFKSGITLYKAETATTRHRVKKKKGKKIKAYRKSVWKELRKMSVNFRLKAI